MQASGADHAEELCSTAQLVYFLLATSAVGSGCTQHRHPPTALRANISGGARQLVGTWKLVSRVVRLEDCTPVQDPGLGNTPSGCLIYDSSGHMAAQLMRPDQPIAIECGNVRPQRSTGGRTDHTPPCGDREKGAWVIETQCPGTPPNPPLDRFAGKGSVLVQNDW